jgi:hypothetical protein
VSLAALVFILSVLSLVSGIALLLWAFLGAGGVPFATLGAAAVVAAYFLLGASL